MERGLLFLEQPPFIEDLGSGYSNVHLNRTEVLEPVPVKMGEETTGEMRKMWRADVQKVKNPVTYDKTVDAAVREEFPNGASDAALRKGITNKDDPDFVKLNEFAEFVKQSFNKG